MDLVQIDYLYHKFCLQKVHLLAFSCKNIKHLSTTYDDTFVVSLITLILGIV